MDCKYVREQFCINFIFHPQSTSIFSLVHYKNRLRIVQENLYTGLVINSFPVPLKLQNLQVDNYILNYNEHLNLIILTLSNYIAIYSVQKKTLQLVAQAQGKNPYYIIKTVTKDKYLYFACTQQRNVYAINLEECIKQGSITNYIKYKISSQVQVIGLALHYKTLVALCSDNVLRMWELETLNSMRGVAVQGVGRPFCLSFSKDGQYLLIGSAEGYIQAWDGPTLGVKNRKIMTEKITNVKIQSLSWFHYSGQNHSHRFLTLTIDGNVKLYSFGLEKKQEIYIGRCHEISLLYISKHKIQEDFQICSHNFANFIFFSPGIMLYMVNIYPLIYYPVLIKPLTYSFEEIVPNKDKQIFYQRDYIFMENLQIKRLTDKVQHKLSLHNDLQYKQLKVLKLDMRPLSIYPSQKYKLMLLYYLKNCVRVFTISNVNLNQQCDNISSYKQYSGNWIMYLGSPQSFHSFILIVQEDKQTITVLAEGMPTPEELEKLQNKEERRYLEMGLGEIYTKKINIKVEKIYPTPFRNHYVVIYQCQNLLRFSSNINYESQMINYEVYLGHSLRLDYIDIIIDVIWSSKGELGAVICLDKVVFINCQLKFMKSVNISGYIVQGQWIGYTLVVTTKVDVQYLDILSKPLQAFSIQNFETSKYLILGILADRVFGVQKTGGKINVKSRYFNLMQPLVAGYLNYQKVVESPIDQILIKRIIQCFAPYYIVSEDFIYLLNDHNLANISKFFLEGNEKMYSRSVRANTLNKIRKVERFIKEEIWLKQKRALLDLFLSYEEAKDSSDPFQKQKISQYIAKLKHIIGDIAFDSVESISDKNTQIQKGITIDNNFGSKTLIQLFCDINKEGNQVQMQIQPFKAQNIGQWIGQFGAFIQSKPFYREIGNAEKKKGLLPEPDSDQDNEFRDLVIYCRIDNGNGSIIEDLSDFGNNATMIGEENTWTKLDEQPMQTKDKWGKKCPPQYSLNCMISFDSKLNSHQFKKGLSVQIWINPMKQSFNILKNQRLLFLVKNKKFILFIQQTQIILSAAEGNTKLSIGQWVHVALVLDQNKKFVQIYLDSFLSQEGKYDKFNTIPPSSMQVGSDNDGLEFTEFRMWKNVIDDNYIRENLRTPLQMVHQKRKKLMNEQKKSKKKAMKKETSNNPFSFPL